jgi:hypothetical protein
MTSRPGALAAPRGGELDRRGVGARGARGDHLAVLHYLNRFRSGLDEPGDLNDRRGLRNMRGRLDPRESGVRGVRRVTFPDASSARSAYMLDAPAGFGDRVAGRTSVTCA